MATWRRKAFTLFPRHAREVTDPTTTIHHLLVDLLPEVRDALACGDDAEVGRIFQFAEWCFHRDDLNNAVAVAFYAHLLDGPSDVCRELARRVPPRIASAIMPLWAARLPLNRLRDVRRLLGGPDTSPVQVDLDHWPHRWFGFWSEYGERYERCPSAFDCVRTNVASRYDKPGLRSYLTTAACIAVTSRAAFADPFTGVRHPGSIAQMTDGVWTWLSDLPDYIERYGLAIPTCWLREIEERGFVPPPVNAGDPKILALLDLPPVG